MAAQSNISANDLLRQMMNNITCPHRSQASEAHFQGDAALLKVKAAGSEEIESYRFVREGGDWKFAN